MSKNIMLQEFNINITGPAHFVVKCGNNEVMVPTFGFNEKGEILDRRLAEKEGYAHIQKEWLVPYIIHYADDCRKKQYRDLGKFGEAIPNDIPIYVGIIMRSDCPNEVGMLSHTEPMTICDSSVTVESVDIYKME